MPYCLGVERFTLNEKSIVTAAASASPLDTALILIVIGAIYFLAALFGEELAFRGYILPKLEERYGSVKAIILCSVIFALWHLPVFFSAYTGGAAESGWISLVMAIVQIGIIVAPICILYLTTRELFGVSLYHALIDVFYYLIFPNPDYGLSAKNAIYHVVILNKSAATAIQRGWPIFSIVLMLGLCRMAKKWRRNT
jgi:membrane protease YdiL (CAAX protease family)